MAPPSTAAPATGPATSAPLPRTTASTAQTTATPATVSSTVPPIDDRIACEPGRHTSDGRLANPTLIETSGLAASSVDPAVLWAHNDSGREAGLYAIDLSGRDLGFHPLTSGGAPLDVVDQEDLAGVAGRLYLADIGDNLRRRETVSIHVVTEPAIGSGSAAEVEQTVEIRYPDGPTDAEALLVDPWNGELLILSKDADQPTDPTRLYHVDPTSPGPDGVVEASLVGSLDVAALTASSALFSFPAVLFPGSATAADVSPDGHLVVVRTYGSAWLFPRAEDQSLAEALGNQPCEGGTSGETQGEAIAFLPSGDPSAAATPARVRYATVAEGRGAAVNVTTVDLLG